jgi:hypothetical protein
MPVKSRLADGARHLALIGGHGAALLHSVRRHGSPIRVPICDRCGQKATVPQGDRHELVFSGSENRCTFQKAHNALSLARRVFERCACLKKWTRAHPRKSRFLRGLPRYQVAEKTAGFFLTIQLVRMDRKSNSKESRQGQFQGQSWGQWGSRKSKPRVYLAFSVR